MTEQDKQEQQQEQGAEEAKASEGAAGASEQQQPQGEARPAAQAGGEKRQREIKPAGPPTAVVEQPHKPGEPVVSRRSVLRFGFWTGLGAVLAGIGGLAVNMLWPRGVTGFGGVVSAGEVSQFPPGSKTQIPEGRFWLVHLTEEQGGPGLLALWWRCPHLGCTVPWRPTFVFPDPVTGAPKQGWFRCPCHGSTYTDAGVRVFGPAPRSMDTMALTVENGRISVDTGSITNGSPDNPDRAVRI